jgi:hypothetical protein
MWLWTIRMSARCSDSIRDDITHLSRDLRMRVSPQRANRLRLRAAPAKDADGKNRDQSTKRAANYDSAGRNLQPIGAL